MTSETFNFLFDWAKYFEELQFTKNKSEISYQTKTVHISEGFDKNESIYWDVLALYFSSVHAQICSSSLGIQ